MDYYEIINSKEFIQWFGDWSKAFDEAGLNFKHPAWKNVSKAVDDSGMPLRLYHGTTHEWTKYSRKLGNHENDMGIGFYATSEYYDAQQNYLKEGKDITAKTAFFAENLAEKKGITTQKARKIINQKYVGDTEKIMEVFLKINRPLIIATKGFEGTFFDFAPFIDKDENYEDSKALIKFKEAFEDVCDDFDLSYDVKIRAWEEFMDNIGELDYVSAYKIIQAIKRIDFFYDYLANEELGGNNVYEFVSQIFQKLRFDGVIYLDASEHFPNMGIPPHTKHFVAFKPNQIKLADGTNTTFDSKNPDIRFDDGGLVYKKKKGNEKEHPHTDVYLGEKYIGYYMPNDSMFSAINENWNFVSKNTDYPNLRARTKNELISMINNINPNIRFSDGGVTEILEEKVDLKNITKSEEFKSWFGDWENDPKNASKMVNEKGEPLICFHGTNYDFNEFSYKAIGSANDRGYYGTGFYFTFQSESKNTKWAISEASYYGKRLIPVFLNIRKPFNFSVLTKYKGVDINYLGTETLVFLYNIAKIFPNISNQIFLDKRVRNSMGEYDIEKTPISILPELIEKYSKELKTFITTDNSGDKIIKGYVKSNIVEYDNTEYGGKKGSYEDREELSGSFDYKSGNYKVEAVEIIFIEKALEKYEGLGMSYYVEGYMTRNPIITDSIKENHDGIIQSEFGDEVIVFEPNKIKLADGTNTTFDSTNNDIRFNDGGGIDIDLKIPIYTAIFVNKDELINKYTPVHKNIFYHHSTIEFKPQDVTDFPKGKETKLDVIGRLTTDKVDVLLVNSPLSKKKNPHITLSTAEGVSPIQSDIEIEENLEKIIPLNDSINGVYDIFYGDNSKIISTDNGSNQVTLKYIKDEKELGYLNYIYDTEESMSVGLNVSPFNFNSEMYIDFIEVYKDYRGKGIAKKLLNKAISDAKKLGIDIITLRRDSGMGCSYGGGYDDYLKKLYSSVGFVETWTEKDVNESGGEKNICAMHLVINKESFDNGGQLESTVAERFNLPVPRNINDLEIGVDEIISQYANRKMASIQVQAYLNENKDLGLQFIKNHNLTNVHELNKYLNNRQSVLRRPILAERKAESNEFEKVKSEVNTDAIVKMAIEQGEQMEKAINRNDN